MLHADLNLDTYVLKLSPRKDENSIIKQSLKISVDLHHNGQNSFYSSLNTKISQALIVTY